MKFLVVAFRKGVLVNTARILQTQIGYFVNNTCTIIGVTPESLKIVKYNLEAYERMESVSELTLKITEDKISLVKFVNEHVQIPQAVDMLTAPTEELEQFYSAEEIEMIMANREFMAGLSDEEKAQENIMMPHAVAIRIKMVPKHIEEEYTVSTLDPEV